MAANGFWEKYRDPRWQKKRLQIMQRAGFKCETCGQEKTLNVHHGYYSRDMDPWDYPDDTLWCLCEDCHDIAGSRKHDCHIELARINPAFMEVVFLLIREFRSYAFLLDDEDIQNKLQLAENLGLDDGLMVILADDWSPEAARLLAVRGKLEAQAE